MDEIKTGARYVQTRWRTGVLEGRGEEGGQGRGKVRRRARVCGLAGKGLLRDLAERAGRVGRGQGKTGAARCGSLLSM